MHEIDSFQKKIKQDGWIKFDQVLDTETIKKLNSGLELAYDNCRAVQVKNGIDINTDGTVHHLLGQQEVFVEIISKGFLHQYIKAFFNQPYIINSYGGVINIKNKLSYVGKIHRDIRTFYNVHMMMNMLVMLDDFTLANGATWFLNGSHLKDEKPGEAYFYKNAQRAQGKAGDIILFDSNLWHAAGENTTENVRRALTLTFTRPFIKQQLDYPRFIGYNRMNEFEDEVQQVLGYHSRIPSNLDEWYQPPHNRFYRPGQG